jgi:hypothetical protein
MKIDDIESFLKDWVPLFQSLVWPIFIGIMVWKFKPQVETFLTTLNDKLKTAKTIDLGKDGIKISSIVSDDKKTISDDSNISEEMEGKLRAELGGLGEGRHLLASSPEQASHIYLRHSAKRDSSLDKNGLAYYRLNFWLDADEKQLLSQVERVIYVLHPTFRNPLREVRSRENDFGMTTIAWGEFNLKAKVYRSDGKTVTLERYIDFGVS